MAKRPSYQRLIWGRGVVNIYTKAGDGGETGLFDGSRVAKNDPRIETYGDIDELNASLGVVLGFIRDDTDIRNCLLTVQRELFVIGAHIADPTARVETERGEKASFSDAQVTRLEQWIDEFEADLPPLQTFILPGGSKGGAALHHARTVCRRAERHIVALSQQEPVSPLIITYMNRLSDLLFVIARLENQRRNRPEIPW